MVTLTMVPNRFESRATAHLIAFKQRKKMMAGGKPVLADSGTLTCVPGKLDTLENKSWV